MNWLYKKCQAVVVSSESEGNFPPQIVEAIYFERPFVAPSIRVVTEVLGPNTNAILFQANSASSLESQIRRVLLDAEAEEEKVRSLKSFMMKDLDSKAKAGLLSVVSEAFALTNNKIGE
jgi:glycosyltransferase involved in cell wall biosynthesis